MSDSVARKRPAVGLAQVIGWARFGALIVATAAAVLVASFFAMAIGLT